MQTTRRCRRPHCDAADLTAVGDDLQRILRHAVLLGRPCCVGIGPTPAAARSAAGPVGPSPALSDDKQHLRSAREVAGYHIHASDGEIGHVEDFLVEDDTRTIRYLLVDTSNWIGGRTVLIAPQWAEHIDWSRHQVRVDVPREAVKNSPEYDPGADIGRAYEERLTDIYRRPARRM